MMRRSGGCDGKRAICLLAGMALGWGLSGHAQTAEPAGARADSGAATVRVEFTNEKLTPSHWVLTVGADGKGKFDAEQGNAAATAPNAIAVGDLHWPIQLSAPFTARVFSVARGRKLFAFPCESHLNVAQQGIKQFSYSGPEGSGSCAYNYSKDKEIQSLGDSFLAVANTLETGARLEKLMQHDHLGVDKELEDLTTAAHEGNAIEMGVIRDILERIAGDDQILERARKKARLLLTQGK